MKRMLLITAIAFLSITGAASAQTRTDLTEWKNSECYDGNWGTFQQWYDNGKTCPGSTAPTPIAPVADYSSSCTDLSCTFTDASTDDGTIVSWFWTFGDGATSTLQNPTHTFSTGGTYTVSLVVTDNDGLTNSTSLNHSVSNSSSGGGSMCEPVTVTCNCEPLLCPVNPPPQEWKKLHNDFRTVEDSPVINVSYESITTSCTDVVFSWDFIGSSYPIIYSYATVKGPLTTSAFYHVPDVNQTVTWTPVTYGCDPLKTYIYYIRVEAIDNRGERSIRQLKILALP